MTQPSPEAQPQPTPETVVLAVKVWAVALALEVIHQVLNVAMGIANRFETAHEVGNRVSESQPQPLPEPRMVELMVVFTNIALGVVSLCIVGVLCWMVITLNRKGRFVGFARRGLTYFGFYLGLRGLIAFAASPVGSVPLALFAIDGSLRIIIGVIGVVAVILCSKDETITWSGEAPLRQLQENMRRDSK